MNAFTTKEYTAFYSRLPAGALAFGARAARRRADRPGAARQRRRERAPGDPRGARDGRGQPEDVVHRAAGRGAVPRPPARTRDGAAARRRSRRSRPTTSAASSSAGTARQHGGRGGRAGRPRAGRAPTVEQPLRRSAAAGRRRTASRPAVPLQALAVDRRRTEQAHLAFGFRACARHDPDREALDVVNHVLGGGLSSRLFEEIREQRGLAYSVYSGTVVVRRRRGAHDLRRHATRAQRRRGARPDRRRAGEAGRRRHHRRRARRRRSATSPAPTCWASRTPAAAWPASAPCSRPPGRDPPGRAAAGPLAGRDPRRRRPDGASRVLDQPRTLAVVGPVSEAVVRGPKPAAAPRRSIRP